MAQTPVTETSVTPITKKMLKLHWRFLCSNMILDSVAPDLIKYDVITPDEWKDLKKMNCVSESSRTEEFLFIIYDQEIDQYDSFARALESAGRVDILDVLQGRRGADNAVIHTAYAEKENKAAMDKDLRSKLDEMLDKFSKFEGKFDIMHEEMLQSNFEVKRLREELASGKVNYSDIKEKLEQKETECRKFQEHNEFLEKQVEKLTEESIANEKLVQDMDRDIEDFRMQIKIMSSQHNNKQEQIAELKNKLMKAENDKKELEQKTASLMEDRKRFTQQVQRNSLQISSLQDNISSIRPWKP